MTLTKGWLKNFGWPQTLLTDHPLAIAHRGASDYAPENTLKAFQIAADLCAEMWELDLHLSADGVCVVSHDDNLKRVSGYDISISQSTWAQISRLPLPEGQRVLRLEDVIALAKKTGCGLYIKLKASGAGSVALSVLQQASFRFACLGSFVAGWVAELRTSGCDYPLSVLVPDGAVPLDYISNSQPDIVHLCWRNSGNRPDRLLTPDLLANLAGFQVVLWDEDRLEIVTEMLGKPVMGICSDRPEMLKPYRPDDAHPIDIVCHRGANILAPENTLDAAKICMDQRFQYLELDVRTTSDGELVVMHDPDLERVTNGSGLVIDHSLAELKTLDAGGWFRSSTAGKRVPTLAQYLEFARGRAKVYVEIKHADPQKLMDIVQAQGMAANCFFWSADTDVLCWLRRKSDDITLMATRWKYASVTEAARDYSAQIVEFDVTKDDLAEISECVALGVRPMIFSLTSDWDTLESYIGYAPALLNLDYPDRFKVLASYPKVARHFRAMKQGHE